MPSQASAKPLKYGVLHGNCTPASSDTAKHIARRVVHETDKVVYENIDRI